MDGLLSKLHKHRKLSHVYVANILLSIHYFLIIYINSSSLERYFSASVVGFLYIAGSVLGLFLFTTAPYFIARKSAYRYLMTITLLECAVTLGLAQTMIPALVAWFFILHSALVPMILYSLDVYLEDATEKESSTGMIRGAYLTLTNVILVISPLLTGLLMKNLAFENVYFFSALSLLPLIWLTEKYLMSTEPKAPKRTSPGKSLALAFKQKDLKYSISAQFILQFFYAWVVIYLPLYLIAEIGFDWQTLGLLFTIMLLPFMIFELPVGWIADHRYGEKEFMIFGFIAMSIAATLLTVSHEKTFTIWAILLFFSRFGASFVEVTNESYFFKQVKSDDSDIISLFRMTRPFAYILAPLIATISLSFLPFSATFWVLGCITLLGSVCAYQITDTR